MKLVLSCLLCSIVLVLFSYISYTLKLREDNLALLQALECGVPKKGEMLHITPKLNGQSGYDCSITSWKNGQYFINSHEK